VLQDLYDLLRKQSESEAQHLATALEIYVHGSLNIFNHHAKAGVLSDLKKEYYQSPGVKRRKKSEAARKNKSKRYN
jgi:hypothetical protein